MYIAYTKYFNFLKNSSVADRVIGKAASMLLAHLEVKEVYTEIISETGIKILNDSNINIEYKKLVPYIKNRDKTDLCPVENLSLNIDESNYEKLIKEIEIFLNTLKNK